MLHCNVGTTQGPPTADYSSSNNQFAYRVLEQAEDLPSGEGCILFMGCARPGLFATPDVRSSYLLRRRGRPDGVDRGSSVNPFHLLYSSDVIQALLTECTWAHAAHHQSLGDSSDSRGVLCDCQGCHLAKKDGLVVMRGKSEGSECAVR